MEQSFKFTVGQRVTTLFGDPGVVSTCAVDDGGVNYYVKTQAGGNWFKEDQLTEAT